MRTYLSQSLQEAGEHEHESVRQQAADKGWENMYEVPTIQVANKVPNGTS